VARVGRGVHSETVPHRGSYAVRFEISPAHGTTFTLCIQSPKTITTDEQAAQLGIDMPKPFQYINFDFVLLDEAEAREALEVHEAKLRQNNITGSL